MSSWFESFPAIWSELAAHYGPTDVGPDSDPENRFGDLLYAVLSRSLGETKVRAVNEALKDAGLHEPGTLAEADPQELVAALADHRLTLAPPVRLVLTRLARWLVDHHDGSVDALAEVSTEQLRDELLSCRGIGAPTADAILLWALDRPVAPVDRASYRILVRHGWLEPTSELDEARSVLETPAGGDASRLQTLLTWLDQVGQDFCRPSVARCEGCPLRPFLPEGGPRRPDESGFC